MTNKQSPTQISIAVIHTLHPQRLMTRLCKHWGHKFAVELAEQHCSIELPLGLCHMRCTDILQVQLHSDAEHISQLQQVVADHLRRMASMEELVIDWQQA